MISYQLIWEVISVGNPVDLLCRCHQHWKIHIPCIAGDNGCTGMLDSSLSSRWQHCQPSLFWFWFVFFSNRNQNQKEKRKRKTFMYCTSFNWFFSIRTKKKRDKSLNVYMLTDKAQIPYRFLIIWGYELKWLPKNQNHKNSPYYHAFFLSLFVCDRLLFIFPFFTGWSKIWQGKYVHKSSALKLVLLYFQLLPVSRENSFRTFSNSLKFTHV